MKKMKVDWLKKMRAIRRHHRRRIILKRYERVRRGNWYVKRPGYLAKNNTLCSCWMCGNLRKYFGKITRQEKRAISYEPRVTIKDALNFQRSFRNSEIDRRCQMCSPAPQRLHVSIASIVKRKDLTPHSLQRFYQRKKAKTNGIVAIKALSNKLARASYYVMRDQVPYDVNKVFG